MGEGGVNPLFHARMFHGTCICFTANVSRNCDDREASCLFTR